jgi:hypothetical protein
MPRSRTLDTNRVGDYDAGLWQCVFDLKQVAVGPWSRSPRARPMRNNRRRSSVDRAASRTVELCCVLSLRETSTTRPPG